MTNIKSLADQIRERQQQSAAKLSKENRQKEAVAKKATQKIQHPESGRSIIEQILESGKGQEMAGMIHIRLPIKVYRKLITLNAAKITMQKFTLFAIKALLEHPEIKTKLKDVINDMD
ncbi:MAG: hypothetical protein AB2L20_12190 [Mangrovibacterium sp.]